MDKLLNFCRQYERIYCYGAGDYGQCLRLYLQMNGIKIQGFIVSSLKENKEMIDGIPIYTLEQIPLSLVKTCIVLSLSEKYHKIIMNKYKNILKILNIDIYKICDDDVCKIKQNEKLIKYDRQDKLVKEILKHGNVDFFKIEEYEKKIKEIRMNYSKIAIQYFPVTHIGYAIFWIFFTDSKKNNSTDIFNLFYPYTNEGGELGWFGANRYLVSKYHAHGMEIINEENISFWSYCLRKYSDYFFFDIENNISDYSRNLIEKFNKFAVNFRYRDGYDYININDKEKECYKLIAERMGIRKKYVCIAARNSSYQKEIIGNYGESFSKANLFRNNSIAMYKTMASYLNTVNYQTVRMGALSDEKISGEGIIDYSSKYRLEAMDVYLFSECSVMVSDPSGIQALAEIFSKPLITVNAVVLTTKNDTTLLGGPNRKLAILKKLWDTRNKRFLTISEMLRVEIDGYDQSDKKHTGPDNTYFEYLKAGIVPIENSPEEICEVMQEMMARLNGTWMESEYDNSLQDRYQSIVNNYPKKGNAPFNWYIGAKFLRDNAWILR